MTTSTVPERIVTFTQGLPGFEATRRFVLVASPSLDPFTLLQGAGADVTCVDGDQHVSEECGSSD